MYIFQIFSTKKKHFRLAPAYIYIKSTFITIDFMYITICISSYKVDF